MTYRLTIAPSGEVESTTPLTDNLVTAASGYEPSGPVSTVKSLIQKTLTKLRFPQSPAKSSITLAVLVPIPDLRPVEVSVPHSYPPEALSQWASTHIENGGALGLQGRWQEGQLLVEDPLAGVVRIEAELIVASFEAPMWVPSQRDHFQADLGERIRSALEAAARVIS